MSAEVLERVAEVAGVTDADITRLLEDEAATEPTPRVMHWVCHCTEHRVSACGLNVSGQPWEPDGTDTPVCGECEAAWPAGWTCPSGCACEDCWRAEDHAA